MDPIAIAQLEVGELACVEGTVRSTGEAPLVSPVSERSCVCYEVHGGLLTGGDDGEQAQPFFVEDASGRVLVTMDRFALQLGELVGQRTLDVLQADIHAVSQQLSDLKVKARDSPAADKRLVQEEITHLKGLATLLCAVRAHAKGNVHVGNTRQGQEQFIRENTEKYSSDQSHRRLSWLYLERYDTVLCDGDQVRVIGVAASERVVGGGARNYREMAKQTVLRAPAGEKLQVHGAGAESANQTLQVKEQERQGELRTRAGRGVDDVDLRWLLLLLLGIAIAVRLCL